MKRLLFIALTIAAQVITCATQLCAQDENIQKEYDAHTEYTYAERYYEYGYFDQAISILNKLQISQDATIRSSAYRLKALCHIEKGDIDQAKVDVEKLLAADPYFSPSASDNPIFLRLINTNKRVGSATITTASQQAETIEESPVPVTLITEEMLHNIGARTVKDALLAYVPGMTDIASNEEMNIAMRGIYSSGQEKILIMLNGHRLNSFATNIACPDFSMSLEKVKQIEILRGPAASLYGGVALTGVINIITKTGAEINGFTAKAAIGNYGQKKTDILFGKRFMDIDVMAWASFYKSDGQKVHYSKTEQPYAMQPIDGYIHIDAYNQKPSYDFGTRIMWKGLSLMYNNRFSKLASPYSMSVMFAPYSYDKFRSFNGNKPGYAVNSQHGELSYNISKKNWNLKAVATIDHQFQQRYQIVGDTVPDFGYNQITPNGTNDTISAYYGYYQNHFWQETAFGANIQGSYNYTWGTSKGVIIAGAHVNRFSLDDSDYSEGDEWGRVLKTYGDEKNMALGSEINADGYVQLKHQWKERFTANAGLRYDYKHRVDGRNINVLSPRIAIIYNCRDWNFKMSYSRAFVDVPYYYRNISLDIKGSGELNPEYINSWQLSFINTKIAKGLSIDAVVFYNYAYDFIYNDQKNGIYTNAGYLKNMGIELSAQYNYKKLTASTNITWQHLLSFDTYNTTSGQITSVPPVKANVILQYKLSDAIELHTHTNILSTQYTENIIGGGASVEVQKLPARAIVNFGGSYTYRALSLSLDIHNLLNKQYYQGGCSNAALLQQSIWGMIGVGIKL